MEKNKGFPGALPDTRSEEAKSKDYYDKEVAGGGVAPIWKERKLSEFAKLYPIRNQDGSSSCVAQTLALMLGIENKREDGRFIEFSAKDIYTRRTNEGGGMIGVESLEIGKNFGATLEIFIPSQNQGESEMNVIDRKPADEQISQIFKTGGYLQTAFDIETIAARMEQYRKAGIAKPFMTWYAFPRAEWDSKPDVTQSTSDMVFHSVTALDYCMINGVKGLVTQDSWGLDSTTEKGLRFLTDEYIKSRMFFSAYLLDLTNTWRDKEYIPTPEKPVVNLTKTLRRGMNDPQVADLQKVLKYEELYPQIADATGYFGSITEKGVREFQTRYKLESDGVVGPITRMKINVKYA